MPKHTQSDLGLEVESDDLPAIAPTESCRDCGDELPLSSFRRHPSNKIGYQLVCTPCSTAAVRRSRGVAREASYMQPTEVDRCGICGGNGGNRGLFLDHDHRSGEFRGWLCHKCNAGIGYFDDNPEWLRSAIRYLHAEVWLTQG